MEEADRVAYTVLNRIIDSGIAKDYAEAIFLELVA